MKKTFVILYLLVIITGCKNKKGLELEIENKSIFSLKNNFKEVNLNMLDSNIVNKSKTILVYKLTNNDAKTYYFNLNYFGSKLANSINGLSVNNSFITFFDEKQKEVKLNYGHIDMDYGTKNLSKERNNQISKFLNYSIDGNIKFILDNNNFIIHPKETLYFEWFLNLPYGNIIQNANIEFDNKKSYNAEIKMFSDSTNYKNVLSRTDLKTIKENGYEVYHGIIKSKNKVPIIFSN